MFKKISLTIITLFILLWAQVSYAVFEDVASNHPNYEAIIYLQQNGIVEGYADNTFRPDQLVNRAEALKIILLGSNIFVPEIQDQEIFPDVIHSTWYGKYAAKAKNLAIISGDGNTGMFRPGDTVNLAEAMKILINANQIKTDFPNSNPHPDVPKDAWFAPYFNYAQSINLLDETYSENVYPGTPVNRGMLAELMYRLSQKPKGYQEGEASYYGEVFHGKTTASGETFDASGFTAAHRTFPFNTWLLVTNLENNESVKVRVNDRGPYASENRIIDLSKAAFESISPLSRGVINVSVQPTSAPQDSSGLSASLLDAVCLKKNDLRYLSKNSYDNITLNNVIPNVLLENEVLSVSGKTISNTNAVSAFIVNKNGEQYSFSGFAESGNFAFDIHFPSVGTFDLGLLPGKSGSSIMHEITILPAYCFNQKQDVSLVSPADFVALRKNGDTVLSWNKGNYQFFKITFTQNNIKKSYIITSNEFKPNYKDFQDFEEKIVTVSLQGGNLNTNFLLESSDITWSSSNNISLDAVIHHEYILNKDEIEIISLPTNITANNTFSIEFKAKVNIDSEGALILPNGEVEKIKLESPVREPIINSNGLSIFSPSADILTLKYKPDSTAIHFAEINNTNGLAVLNIPLYPSDKYPLLPNPVEVSGLLPVNLGNDMSALRNKMLNLVNADRNAHGKPSLVLDSSLNNLAQFRSDYIAEYNYFSHWDKEGRSANDIRKNYAISQAVAENIAKDVTLELSEYGLMRSAMHRSNILNYEWTRAGFGITKYSDGGYVFVQIFSADPINPEDVNYIRQTILNAVNENRNINLILQTNLNNLSQNWSEKMVSQDFFDFMAPDGSTLVNEIRNSGIKTALGTYIIGNTSLQNSIEQVSKNAQLLELNWKDLGIGIKQDSLGIIKITLIYTE